ncbi:hypothetical protein DFR24_4308 [Panacagrimonas perspica]|uniref:Uncharacterized protein n=1 Tax=Panacagrimonas perspica TaxID=381431 RepID=A0A4V3URG1_9GAMM|nr:hypothetical protein [Panacagrimonas perspica]TDU25863.1 hypothetical protein DFR24_4308 [Panacagrimonas perspica]THD02771.1 hypothetical protein B1810_12680 [Panacagrimonas perspica]
MAAKLKLDGLPGELADRARAVFGGVVNDLDQLLKKLGGLLSTGAGPSRKELLRLISALRKSLDARLSALERAVGGSPAKKKRPAARKAAAKKVAKKAATKAVKKAVRKPVKSAARRKR